MNNVFQIGDFCFRMICDEGIQPPKNFMLFEVGEEHSCECEYVYEIFLTEVLPKPTGVLIAERLDLKVFQNGACEERYIGIKGMDGFYACYREIDEGHAVVWLDQNRITGLHIDPVFTSLLALERHLIGKHELILHCAYMEYQGEAILFSAPSETGKTTQANLWEKYRKSRTVNGDRALLSKRDGVWTAGGWPVCGTSEICNNEAFPIRAIVMLSQAKENNVRQIRGKEAFLQVLSQITANRWNREASMHAMDVTLELLGEVPVYHLSCNMTEDAVICLEKGLGR